LEAYRQLGHQSRLERATDDGTDVLSPVDVAEQIGVAIEVARFDGENVERSGRARSGGLLHRGDQLQ
jgi:hypothetical protein